MCTLALANATTTVFDFHLNGEDFQHLGQPMALPYGLLWQVSVVISLSQLLSEITAAARRVLIITVSTIAVLSVSAGLLIAYLVTAPLVRLSQQMEEVAEMNLKVIQQRRSRFKEIADIQAFFGSMVERLTVRRSALVSAHLFFCLWVPLGM